MELDAEHRLGRGLWQVRPRALLLGLSHVAVCGIQGGTGIRGHSAGLPDSFDILPAFLGQSKTGRPHLVENATSLALVEGDWKLIRRHPGPKTNQTGNELGNNDHDQLFNIRRDPDETENLADREPERVKQMLATLEKIEKTGHSRP